MKNIQTPGFPVPATWEAEPTCGAQWRGLVRKGWLDSLPGTDVPSLASGRHPGFRCTLHIRITGVPLLGPLCARQAPPPTSLRSPHPQTIRCSHLHSPHICLNPRGVFPIHHGTPPYYAHPHPLPMGCWAEAGPATGRSGAPSSL